MTPAAEITARIVASHIVSGHASRRRMVPRELAPDFIEAEYASKLVAEVNDWRDALAPLLTELPEILTSARADSVANAIRLDDLEESRRVRASLEFARMVARQTKFDIQNIASGFGRRVADHQRTQLDRQLKAALGVSVPTPDRKVPGLITHFTSESVAKIRDIGDRALAGVERVVGEAFTSRLPVDEVRALIAKNLDSAEKAARRLAADQVAKLTALVRQSRHLELGIGLFVWKTMRDPLVRDSHARRHNKVYAYRGENAPPYLPGEEHGCRCRAVPVFDEIRDLVAKLLGRQAA